MHEEDVTFLLQNCYNHYLGHGLQGISSFMLGCYSNA